MWKRCEYAYELDSDVKAVNATNATLMHASGHRHHAELHAGGDLQGDSVSRR